MLSSGKSSLLDPDASSDEGMEVGTVVGETVNTSLVSSNTSSVEVSSDITAATTEVFLVLVAGRKLVEAPEDPCASVPTSDSTQELRSICFVLRCDILKWRDCRAMERFN